MRLQLRLQLQEEVVSRYAVLRLPELPPILWDAPKGWDEEWADEKGDQGALGEG